ncbi:MAG: hypothetical protein AAB695_01960 [Patescibacteria group bacterium]
MSQKTFNSIAGLVFLLVAVMHLLRIANGWAVTMGSFDVPMWASWIGVIVAGYLAYHGLKKR